MVGQDSYSFQKSACVGTIVLSLVSQSAQSSMPTLHRDGSPENPSSNEMIPC